MADIDIHSESLLTIPQASAEIPLRPHASTIWRWMRRGTRGIKLESVIVAGRRYTSREAIQRFLAATGDTDNPTYRNEYVRRRRHAAAERELAADGI